MNAIISILIAVIPLLRDYLTKNSGLNTVTGGVLGAFGVLLVQGLEQNQGSIDQIVTYLSNQGQYGVFVAAGIVALRAAVFFLRAK